MSTEWGKKRMCTACFTLFYDFGKSPIICPRCGEKVAHDDFLKKRAKQQDRYADLASNIIDENITMSHEHEDHSRDDDL